MTDPILLLNASHPLPPDWEPDDLVDLWAQQPRHFLLPMRREFLSRVAFEAANALFAEAEAAGFDDFEVRSAYRDYERQAALYAADPQSGLVAKPGLSEHQTGLALDVGTWKGPFLSDANARYRAWVAEHCWDFGLVIRYPAGKEDVTGVPAEPWHLRYVGRDMATQMRNRGWVLEEWHESRRIGAQPAPQHEGDRPHGRLQGVPAHAALAGAQGRLRRGGVRGQDVPQREEGPLARAAQESEDPAQVVRQALRAGTPRRRARARETQQPAPGPEDGRW